MRVFLCIISLCLFWSSLQAVDTNEVKKTSYQIETRINIHGHYASDQPVVFTQKTYGCGIAISPLGYILTNHHVVEFINILNTTMDIVNINSLLTSWADYGQALDGIDSIKIYYKITDSVGKVYETDYFPEIISTRDNQGELMVEIVKLEKRTIKNRSVELLGGNSNDLFLLKLNITNKIPYVHLADQQNCKNYLENSESAQQVFALSYDKNRAAEIKIGKIHDWSLYKISERPTIKIAMTATKGNSGSGVVDACGKLVGILWGSNFQGIAMMIPGKKIKEFILENKAYFKQSRR